MIDFIASPVFGFTLTVAVMIGYQVLFSKWKSPLLSPFIFSIATIIALLLALGIPYESYRQGASVLSYFMGPAIVALAVPLYRQFDKLKAHALPILFGIACGVFVSITSGVFLSHLFGLNQETIISIAPQGTSSAIAMSLSQALGGDPAMTVAFVNVAGNFGYLAGVFILKFLGIQHPIARGVALGTASHAMGTTRALALGEEEGAMASLSIGLAGVFTSVLMPLLLGLFGLL